MSGQWRNPENMYRLIFDLGAEVAAHFLAYPALIAGIDRDSDFPPDEVYGIMEAAKMLSAAVYDKIPKIERASLTNLLNVYFNGMKMWAPSTSISRACVLTVANALYTYSYAIRRWHDQADHHAVQAITRANKVIGEKRVTEIMLIWIMRDCATSKSRIPAPTKFPPELVEAFTTVWETGVYDFACSMVRDYMKR